MDTRREIRALAVGAAGPDAPSFRVRTRVPSAAVATHGVRLEHAPLFDADAASAFASSDSLRRARVLLRARRNLRQHLSASLEHYDAVLLQRQVDMLPSRGLERAVLRSRRTVLDVDDAIWLDTSRDADAHPLAFLKDSRRKLAWLASEAHHVMAGNATLADWLSQHSNSVEIVPSTVDTDASPLRQHDDGDKVVLGWLGSRSTAGYLDARADALDASAKASKLPLELHVVGGPAPSVHNLAVRTEAWSPDTERALLERMDIGIMPLPDNAWTRGKCAYKALVYMAAGIPAIVDDVGVSAEVVGNGQAGMAVSTTGEWIDAILGLADSTQLRSSLGQAGRERVISDYSVAAWAPTIAAALKGDAGSARPGIP